MKKLHTQSSVLSTKVVAGLVVASQVIASAEEVSVEEQSLETTTILASKFENPVDKTVSSVSVISGEEIDKKQQVRLVDALNDLAGVQALSTAGQIGAPGTLIVRGLPTKYNQIVVDGVRVTESNNATGNFLGAAQTNQVSQLEILRGPQSVLYGADAAGGVIGISSQLGESDPNLSLFAEGGSFNSYRLSAASQGQIDSLQYALEFGRSYTENDRTESFPTQDYQQDSAVFGLKWNATQDLSFQFNYRGSRNDYDSTQITAFGENTNDVKTDINLLSFNTNYVVSESLQTQLNLGYYEESYNTKYATGTYASDKDVFSLNWSNQWEAFDTVTIVGGVEYRDAKLKTDSVSSFFGNSAQAPSYDSWGLYVDSFWAPVQNALVEAGVRYDDNSRFGENTPWNVGASYEFVSETRIRARAARSFRSPTFGEAGYFVDSTGREQLGNPNLKSEKILGYEIGVDQQIIQDHALSVTYFYQNIESAIGVDPSSTSFVSSNINFEGDSLVSGFETTLRGSFMQQVLKYDLAWTAQIKEEVIDVPDHIFNGNLYYDAQKWVVGVGASYLDGASYGRPEDSNFVATDSRFVTRLFGNYIINENVKIHGRIENLFDENYLLSDIWGDQIHGQGFGAFGGVTVTF